MIATVENVLQLGFDSSQFGVTPEAFSLGEAGGYVYDLLVDVALEVENEVGATIYADANAAGTAAQRLAHARLKQAEVYLAAERLWRRRIAKLDANGTITQRADQPVNLMKQYRDQADDYKREGWAIVERMTGAPRTGGIGGKVVESGHYSPVLS